MTGISRGKSLTRRIRAAAIAVPALLASGLAAQAEEKGLWERDKLTGTWGGTRTALEDKGIDIGLAYIGEALAIPTGGLMRGTTFEGRLDLTVNTDLEKLMGWAGGKAHMRVFQIHSARNFNALSYVGSIADPSNIDAYGTTRLFTAWVQQEFGTVASLRVGQLAGDDEFLVSSTAGGLINGTYGWAAMMAANLPSGGPAYPLATPGIRLQVNPTDTISLLGAVFSGDPAGPNCTNPNPQICNRYGTTFSFSGGAFWLGEAQYQVNQAKDATGLAAAYKLGLWYHSGERFADQALGIDSATGLIVPRPVSDSPLNRHGNWGIYGVIDQMVWRRGDASTSFFVRAGALPADRNLVSWYIDGGVGFKGFMPSRPADTLTFGLAHSHISPDAVAADQYTAANIDPMWPIRSGETVFEASYIAQIAPWWTLQPDFQYIVRPAGNVPINPANTALGPIKDAIVVGVRTTITF
ncbi:MAG: carbohydrate porin [Xanthobacteraceae bacterium]|nr:MAG: carbohydrate porin [Xanthobacteraceae bacterium]